MWETNVAVGLLKKIVERGCEPDLVTYSVIIDALREDMLVVKALDLLSNEE